MPQDSLLEKELRSLPDRYGECNRYPIKIYMGRLWELAYYLRRFVLSFCIVLFARQSGRWFHARTKFWALMIFFTKKHAFSVVFLTEGSSRPPAENSVSRIGSAESLAFEDCIDREREAGWAIVRDWPWALSKLSAKSNACDKLRSSVSSSHCLMSEEDKPLI